MAKTLEQQLKELNFNKPEASPPSEPVVDDISTPEYTQEQLDAVGIIDPNTGTTDGQPVSTLTPDDLKELETEAVLDEKYGDSEFTSAGLGALRGATLGLSDQALVKSGIMTADELREIKERNELSAIAGEVAGTIGGVLATGGTSAAAKGAVTAGKIAKGIATPIKVASKAGQLGEQITAAGLKKILKQTGNEKIARSIIQKSIEKGAGSAVEGALFGTGQLISEDALGTAEFNAENLLSAAGHGAAFGGTVGSMFGGAEALLPTVKKVVEKGKTKFKESFSKYANKEDAALELAGYTTPAAKNKIKNLDPKLVEELPDFIARKAKVGYLTSDTNLYNSIEQIKNVAGKEIGDVLKQVDDISRIDPTILPTKMSVYGKIAKELDDTYIKPNSGLPGYKSKIKPIQDLKNEFLQLAKEPGTININKLQEMRIKYDKLAKLEKELGKKTFPEQAATTVRQTLRKEIDDLADRASKLGTNQELQTLGLRLAEANKDFHIAAQLLPTVSKKLDKNKLFSLTDFLAGSVGGALGAEGVVGLVGLKKIAESDLRRKFIILNGIENQAQKINRKISSATKSFFDKTRKVTPPTVTVSLMNSPFGVKYEDGERPKKPKTKEQAFQNITNNLNELATDPTKVINRINQNLEGVRLAAPQAADAAAQNILKSMEFLSTKLPRDTADNGALSALNRPYTPSSLEMSKFNRYLSAIEDPLSVVQDFESGTVTREQVEALRVAYPEIYTKLQLDVMDKLTQEGQNLSYNKKIQLGILLDVPTDVSLQPQSIRELQSQFLPQDPQNGSGGAVKTTRRGLEDIEMAERSETTTQRVRTR